MPPMNEVLEWRGQTMVGSGGDKIGKIEEIYLDTETDRPEWALVHTGLFGSASSFVPIANASAQDGDVRVPFEKAQVKDAPKLEPDGRLSQQDESALYSHYGMDYSEDRSDSGLPEGEAAATTSADTSGAVGEDVSGPETDHAMTRSEEELRVEREPITDANRDAAGSGADLSEEEHEVVLHEEEVVVDKRTVAKERVRLDKDTVTEDQQVSEGVRKEQVELIDGGLSLIHI